MGNLFPELSDNEDTSSSYSGMFPELSGSQNDPITLYLMRHTSTDIDDQDKSHGWLDPAINAKGTMEAAMMAKDLQGVHLDSLITSDLQRARQTGDFIAQATGTQAQATPSLRPLNMGQYSGATHDQIHSDLAPLFKRWQDGDTSLPTPGGESFDDFQNRNAPVLKQVMNMDSGSKVGIVGHSMTMKLFKQLINNGGEPVSGQQINETLQDHEPHMEIIQLKKPKLGTPTSSGVRG